MLGCWVGRVGLEIGTKFRQSGHQDFGAGGHTPTFPFSDLTELT
jgi:hypothetical protein